jgi:squalene-hopene/tetraprenyl-beta-curcumene cyclase
MAMMTQCPAVVLMGKKRVAQARSARLLRFVALLSAAIGGATAHDTAAEQAAADADGNVDVGAVVKRSVPFIEREGASWMAARGCVSCHHSAFMVWSLRTAKRSGASIDDEKLRAWTEWAGDYRHLMAPPADGKNVQREAAMGGQSDTLAQLVLSQSGGLTNAERPMWATDYLTELARQQQADGYWKSGGQLPSQKRPKRETQEVSTMWALIAMGENAEKKATTPANVTKAVQWLGEETAGKSTEWWAARTLLERQLGRSQKAEHYYGELLNRQHSDGGWGWLCDDESDALGTGIALYSVSGGKDGGGRAAVARAREFLARTQADDGSWPVRGTKESAKDRVTPTATFWGTCWAVIGLSQSK